MFDFFEAELVNVHEERRVEGAGHVDAGLLGDGLEDAEVLRLAVAKFGLCEIEDEKRLLHE